MLKLGWQAIAKGLQKGLSICLPGQCAACAMAIPVQWDGKTARLLCFDCEQALFNHRVRCIQCGLTLGPRIQAFGWTRCRHCKLQPSNVYTVTTSCYKPPVDDLIVQLKFRQETGLAKLFAEQLLERFLHMGSDLQLPDVWLPIPSSTQRIKKRGYNQSLLIARSLSVQTGLPCLPNALYKTRHTPAQASLSDAARQTNLKDAFVCEGDLKDLRVGLVDDVMTTGATLRSVGEALARVDVKHISHWIVARTPE